MKSELDILLPYITPKDRKQFQFSILAPLAAAGVSVADEDAQLKLWERTYGMQRLKLEATGYKELPTVKHLEWWEARVTKLMEQIKEEKSVLSDYLIQLNNELETVGYSIRRVIKNKKDHRSISHKYPKGVVSITHSLIQYWNDWTKKKYHITGYGYNLEDEPERKKFNIKTDPGECFLQRALATYFDRKYTCYQIKTLVELTKDIKGIPSKMLRKDYVWWHNDPMWANPKPRKRKKKNSVKKRP